MKKIKVFYDGTNIKDFAANALIKGFTTNTSFLAQAGITDLKAFMKESVELASGRPISFQITDPNRIVEQARIIAGYGANVFVKVPISSPNGDLALKEIAQLQQEGINVNVTWIYTVAQLKALYPVLTSNTPAIVSIFAGGIADTGVSPEYILKYGILTFSHLSSVEILWAGCQSIRDIFSAETYGCHIVTVPDAILKRTNRVGIPLEKAALDKARLFYQDGEKIQL